jgi:hypothetical protein
MGENIRVGSLLIDGESVPVADSSHAEPQAPELLGTSDVQDDTELENALSEVNFD